MNPLRLEDGLPIEPDDRSVDVNLFSIERGSFMDGPGLRTVVFFKGCPLRCVWCHNPESLRSGRDLLLDVSLCSSCGRCVEACRRGAISLDDRGVLIHRGECIRCGVCAEACPTGALSIAGKSCMIEEILSIAERDRPFYEESGGGLTASGGEPLFQFNALCALFREAKRRTLHTALDTSGFLADTSRHIEELLPWTDIFLWDFKESDPVFHLERTGVPLEPILRNLEQLDRLCDAPRVILRCPIIPTLNDRSDHFEAIAHLANRLSVIREIHLIPYHALGNTKRVKLGDSGSLAHIASPTPEEVEKWRDALRSMCAKLTDP